MMNSQTICANDLSDLTYEVKVLKNKKTVS